MFNSFFFESIVDDETFFWYKIMLYIFILYQVTKRGDTNAIVVRIKIK